MKTAYWHARDSRQLGATVLSCHPRHHPLTMLSVNPHHSCAPDASVCRFTGDEMASDENSFFGLKVPDGQDRRELYKSQYRAIYTCAHLPF